MRVEYIPVSYQQKMKYSILTTLVICHHGEQIKEGHYASLIRHQNNIWLMCNDTQINYERWPRGRGAYYINIYFYYNNGEK